MVPRSDEIRLIPINGAETDPGRVAGARTAWRMQTT